MAKVCIQCDKKLGMFQKPVDGIYCSVACRDGAKAQIVENERRSQERIVEAERASQRHVQEQAVAAAQAARLGTCPKCSKQWSVTDVGGSEHKGECPSCSFSASFVDIEHCKTCRGPSMIVAADGSGKCPRCKSRK
jgi:hypothetical protein